jgi:hypothetical protein
LKYFAFLKKRYRVPESRSGQATRHECLGCAPEARISIKKDISNSGYTEAKKEKCMVIAIKKQEDALLTC